MISNIGNYAQFMIKIFYRVGVGIMSQWVLMGFMTSLQPLQLNVYLKVVHS